MSGCPRSLDVERQPTTLRAGLVGFGQSRPVTTPSLVKIDGIAPIHQCVAKHPNSDRGMGFLWWSFNSFVCVAGGFWALWIGLWWGGLGIIAGLAGIPIIARKVREGNWF